MKSVEDADSFRVVVVRYGKIFITEKNKKKRLNSILLFVLPLGQNICYLFLNVCSVISIVRVKRRAYFRPTMCI